MVCATFSSEIQENLCWKSATNLRATGKLRAQNDQSRIGCVCYLYNEYILSGVVRCKLFITCSPHFILFAYFHSCRFMVCTNRRMEKSCSTKTLSCRYRVLQVEQEYIPVNQYVLSEKSNDVTLQIFEQQHIYFNKLVNDQFVFTFFSHQYHIYHIEYTCEQSYMLITKNSYVRIPYCSFAYASMNCCLIFKKDVSICFELRIFKRCINFIFEYENLAHIRIHNKFSLDSSLVMLVVVGLLHSFPFWWNVDTKLQCR